MRILFLFICTVVLIFSIQQVQAESSWDKLIGEIDQKTPSKQGGAQVLEMPDMSEDTQAQAQEQGAGDGEIQLVPSYRCLNPRLPRCMIRMGRKSFVDFQSCRNVTRSYLQSLASYNRCVNRQTRRHARKVVDYFNCKARGGRDCPSIY